MYSPQSHQGSYDPDTEDESSHTQEPLPHPSSAQISHHLHDLDAPSSSWPSTTMATSMEHDFANLCLSPLHSCWTSSSYSSSTLTNGDGLNLPTPSPMLLLHDPSVDKELGWIARKLVRSQRHHNAEDGAAERASPNLFVILPMTPIRNASKIQSQQDPIISGVDAGLDEAARNDDFCLFFLCDYGDDDDSPLRLHICEDGSSSPPEHGVETSDALTTNESCNGGGFRLRDLDDFLIHHTVPMLALLRALLENDDPYVSGTGAYTSAITGRICAAIRFLATRAHEVLLDIRDHPLVHDEELEEHHAAMPRLQENDFWYGGSASNGQDLNSKATNDIDARSAGAAVMRGGMLYQAINANRGGSILWQCQTHNDLFCAASAKERLRLFVMEHNGIWIPIKMTIEIRLKSREDASVFYEILSECNCVEELRICLDWHDDNGVQTGVTETDLWQLAEAVHVWNLRDLALDCGGEYTVDSARAQYESNAGKQNQGSLQFRPLLGMICRAGLESFAVEGFDGSIFPGGVAIQVQGSPDAFSLQQLRESDALIVPENISLKKLAFRRWKHYPDAEGLASIVKCSTNLTEIESQTSSLQPTFFSIQNATVNMGNITLININESSEDSTEIAFWRLEEGRPAIRKLLRRGSDLPSRFLQIIIGIEHWSVTKCVRLWEHPENLHNIIRNNFGSLKSMDIVCETEFFGELWPLIIHELMEAEVAAAEAVLAHTEEEDIVEASHAEQVTLVRLKDLKGHCLESLSSQRLDHTSLVLNSYDGNFRLHMQPLGRVATALSIAYDFTSTSEMELLLQHVAADGLWFNELGWFLTSQTRDDAGFMAALQTLVRRHEVHKLTIRIDGGNGGLGGRAGSVLPMKQIQTLLQVWDDLTGMSLGWSEYGRWMQELAAQLDHPFHETVYLPTGAGELTFASEGVVEIGVPPVRVSAFVSNMSASEVSRGPVIYVLSCRCI